MYHQSKETILVCSPSNVSIDNIALFLEDAGLNVIRIFSKTREAISSEADHLALHNKIRDLKNGKFRRMNQLFKLVENGKTLIQEEEDEFLELKNLA
jgi:predicted transcriptional regulator